MDLKLSVYLPPGAQKRLLDENPERPLHSPEGKPQQRKGRKQGRGPKRRRGR